MIGSLINFFSLPSILIADLYSSIWKTANYQKRLFPSDFYRSTCCLVLLNSFSDLRGLCHNSFLSFLVVEFVFVVNSCFLILWCELKLWKRWVFWNWRIQSILPFSNSLFNDSPNQYIKGFTYVDLFEWFKWRTLAIYKKISRILSYSYNIVQRKTVPYISSVLFESSLRICLNISSGIPKIELFYILPYQKRIDF